MSRFKNGLISFRFFNNDSQMEIRSIKFFTVKSRSTQIKFFFLFSLLQMI